MTETMNISQSKRSVSRKGVNVIGMITSYSTSYKVVAESKWECINCSSKGKCSQGNEIYNPPLTVPREKFDDTRGFELLCPECKSNAFTVDHAYRNARSIQLEDSDKNEDSMDRLDVVLLDDAASNLIAGEIVEISGDLHIQRKSEGNNSKSVKKLVTVLYGDKIRYLNKERVIITQKDIEIFHKHKSICEQASRIEAEAALRLNDGALTEHKIIPMNYVGRLVAMFAPNVIGHNDVKLGLLRSMVGGRMDHGDDNGRRGRIPSLLIGDKGTAKTVLARESTKIIPKSRFVNAQNTSGKSLIGVVDKETDGGLFLRLGPVVLAKLAICAINEIGSMSMEDQGHLTDIEEEGRTTLVKYGATFELDAPTTIVATANQYNTEWESPCSVSKDEFPILKTLVDRNDQVYAFRDSFSREELEEYVREKTKIRKRRPHNYNFLRKLLVYAKTNIKPEVVPDSELRLNEFWTEARLRNVATNRTYDAIFRIAEATAKLNLNEKMDDEIVEQTMDSLSIMWSQYGQFVKTIDSPKDVAYQAFLDILKQNKVAMSIDEIYRLASEENKLISEYLGPKSKLRDNMKLRMIVDRLLNHDSVRQIQERPLVLQWRSECDICDVCDTKTSSKSSV